MLLFQALVLGLLQGLTEFLPVSSSGHLQGVPYLLGWPSGSLAFDVMVHAGTLVAVVAYFRTDLLALARGALGLGDTSGPQRRQAWVLIALLGLASIPAAAAGLLFSDVFEAAFASPRAVALFLYVTALLLWAAERLRARRLAAGLPAAAPAPEVTDPDAPPIDRPDAPGLTAPEAEELTDPSPSGDDLGRDVASLRVRDGLAMGLAQALAIFPGISRSGATIATGMALGLSRTAAARFSFLMAIPVIIGATALTAGDLGTPEPGTLPFGPVEITVGVVAAMVSGYWAIHTLLRVVQQRDLLGFARYVVVFGTVLLVATFIRG